MERVNTANARSGTDEMIPGIQANERLAPDWLLCPEKIATPPSLSISVTVPKVWIAGFDVARGQVILSACRGHLHACPMAAHIQSDW